MRVVPAVVTGNSDDYAAFRPNLIDSRAFTVGTLPAVSMAKLAPNRGPRKAFLRRIQARLRKAHFVPTDGTLYRIDRCIGQLAVYERESDRGDQR
jgi:hypothetical protein